MAARGPAMKRDCMCKRARHVHGTVGAYNYDGCRCVPCRAAKATRAREHRRVVAQRRWNGGSAWCDSTGTMRRLRALAAAGWSLTELAPHLQMHGTGVSWLRNKMGDTCLVVTARKIADVYEDLWWRNPTGVAVERTARWALRRGWAEPWQWEGVDIDDPNVQPHTIDTAVDEVKVHRVIAGEWMPLTSAEKAEAVRLMAHAGRLPTHIAKALRLNGTRVNELLDLALVAA